MSKRRTLASSLLGCLLLAAGAQAQPPAPGGPGTQLVGETVADRPSALYRFERHLMDSADGKRHYRIEIAIPRTPPPAGGYAALYMLDGNAAMDTLTDADLARLARTRPPVLVAVGYDVPTRNDVVARAYDYTPPVRGADGKLVETPIVRGRPGGGADVFLQLIVSRVKPLVGARARVDPKRAYLWGHSYGGLFTLHTLYTQPDTFARYIAGDPSAWWHDGALIDEWRAFDARRAAGKRVAILVGTKPRDPARPAPNPPPAHDDGADIDPRKAVREMAEGLRRGGADVDYEAFPQYGHGDMIRVSLERALEIATQP